MLRLTIALLCATTSVNAFAYLDPGTGSLILQGLIAGFAVAGLTIKNYWYRFRGLFGKSKGGSLLEDDLEQDPEDGNK